MQRMLNEATDFREEMIDGYVAAFGRYVRRVPGASGIATVSSPTAGQVGVVVGGGSGHYPAFFGLVGEGMASAAVIGDIFTSPSGEQAYRVAKAVDGGAGILFTFGNYAGDVLNFGMAESRLRAEGIDARTVLVTDDVLSAPANEADRRRGIAGGFFVFKAAGASATRGDDIATVEALAQHANRRTRTAGVGFAGCTVPGQDEPLFTVAPGQMEIGLGIHGERGVRVTEQMPAAGIAKLLVETLLAETPPGVGSKAAVLLNGLGGTKYEELFVLYHGIAPLLKAAGIEAHEPRIGEYVTSLDMAGCSLTLCWLDDDLEPLIGAAASTPAYTQFGPDLRPARATRPAPAATSVPAAPPSQARPTADTPASGGRAGELARAAIANANAAIAAAEADLNRLDAAAGDGDHGAAMARGFRAAEAATAGASFTARQTFTQGGAAFQDAAGGASGALVGAWLIAIGGALPGDDALVDAAAISHAMESGLAALQRLGHAQPGDKTMVDTMVPFVTTLEVEIMGGANSADAWAHALAEAEAGMTSTIDLVSQRGRSSRLGERSRGYQDAGATSMYYVLRAFGAALATA